MSSEVSAALPTLRLCFKKPRPITASGLPSCATRLRAPIDRDSGPDARHPSRLELQALPLRICPGRVICVSPRAWLRSHAPLLVAVTGPHGWEAPSLTCVSTPREGGSSRGASCLLEGERSVRGVVGDLGPKRSDQKSVCPEIGAQGSNLDEEPVPRVRRRDGARVRLWHIFPSKKYELFPEHHPRGRACTSVARGGASRWLRLWPLSRGPLRDCSACGALRTISSETTFDHLCRCHGRLRSPARLFVLRGGSFRSDQFPLSTMRRWDTFSPESEP